LPSSQLGAEPPTHAPSEHASPVVQALPSSHEIVLLLCTQPVGGLHVSSVQALPSSQFGAEPPTHAPPEHASPIVQALPSSHDAVLLECTQPDAGLHVSSVQALPSSQFGAEPATHTPAEQASPVVHALPSSHDAVLFVCTQPDAALQESSVHGLPSSQFGAAPPTHTPAEQASPVVHALPSSHDAVLSVFMQPVAGLQLSSVQPLLSLQFGAEPPTQAPPEQASAVVQALPSSHGTVLFECTHPDAGLQLSSVQPLPSSQFGAEPPTHVPAEQVSAVVHALPSSHDAVLFAC
jgi:hypothetical protein